MWAGSFNLDPLYRVVQRIHDHQQPWFYIMHALFLDVCKFVIELLL